MDSVQTGEAEGPQAMDEGEDKTAAGPAQATASQKPGISCLMALQKRCSDRAPTVRGKAIGNLASLLGSGHNAVQAWAQQASAQCRLQGGVPVSGRGEISENCIKFPQSNLQRSVQCVRWPHLAI